MSNEIKFRKLSLDDIKSLHEIYSDKEAMKYRGSSPIETIEHALIFIRNQELLVGGILTIRKGIELSETQELIGSVMYKFDEGKRRECEIGYSIGRRFWGKGYGKEIVRILLETIQENKDIDKVIAWSHQENIASIKILKKNGFLRIENQGNSNNYLYHKKIK